jgi:hypothetical protein
MERASASRRLSSSLHCRPGLQVPPRPAHRSCANPLADVPSSAIAALARWPETIGAREGRETGEELSRCTVPC